MPLAHYKFSVKSYNRVEPLLRILALGGTAARFLAWPVLTVNISTASMIISPASGAAPMRGLSRRAFFGVSVGGLSALNAPRTALAAMQGGAIDLTPRANIDYASALNLNVFLQNIDTRGLVGLLSMNPVNGELCSYTAGALFLFPFKYDASTPEFPAFLPGPSAASPLIATLAMTPGGLPPDDYFCSYVLKTPHQSFISFSVGAPFVRGAQKWPWHTNLDGIGGSSIGIGWTSSNFNHPWFAGSHWIPDGGNGKYWRARIIEGIRQAAAIQVSTFGGAVG